MSEKSKVDFDVPLTALSKPSLAGVMGSVTVEVKVGTTIGAGRGFTSADLLPSPDSVGFTFTEEVILGERLRGGA